MVRAPRKPSGHSFYKKALTEAERVDLRKARKIEGFDEEIAALRLRLRTMLGNGETELALLLRGMDVLRRLVATKYGLSKDDEDALKTAFAQETLRRLQERGEGGVNDDDA